MNENDAVVNRNYVKIERVFESGKGRNKREEKEKRVKEMINVN